MILLKKTYKDIQNGKVRLVYPTQIDDNIREIYVEVEKEYEDKLCINMI